MKKFAYLAALIVTLFVVAGCTPAEKKDGKYTEIAKCLTEKGVIFYGAYWCPHCADQKKIFGDDLRYIKYVECDPKGENADPADCQKAGVENYPTWAFPGQDKVTGVRQPEELAKKANCPIAALAGTQQSKVAAPSLSAGTTQTTLPVALPVTTQSTK